MYVSVHVCMCMYMHCVFYHVYMYMYAALVHVSGCQVHIALHITHSSTAGLHVCVYFGNTCMMWRVRTSLSDINITKKSSSTVH